MQNEGITVALRKFFQKIGSGLRFFHSTGPGVVVETLPLSYRAIPISMNDIQLGHREGVTLPEHHRLSRPDIEKHVWTRERLGESVTADMKYAEYKLSNNKGTILILKNLKAVNVQQSAGVGDKDEYLVRIIKLSDVVAFFDVTTRKLFFPESYKPTPAPAPDQTPDSDQNNRNYNPWSAGDHD